MPIITIDIVPQSYEKKTEIAKEFTDKLHEITGIPKESMTVIFHEESPENIADGGVMLKEKFNNMNKKN